MQNEGLPRQHKTSLLHKLLQTTAEHTKPPSSEPPVEQPILFNPVQGDDRTGFRSTMTGKGLVIDWFDNDLEPPAPARHRTSKITNLAVFGGAALAGVSGYGMESGIASPQEVSDGYNFLAFNAGAITALLGIRSHEKQYRSLRTQTEKAQEAYKSQQFALEPNQVTARAFMKEKSLIIEDIPHKIPSDLVSGLLQTDISISGLSVPAARAFVALEGVEGVNQETITINPAHGIGRVLKNAGDQADYLIEHTISDLTTVCEQQLVIGQSAVQLALYSATGNGDTASAIQAQDIYLERLDEYLQSYLRIGAAQVVLEDNLNLNPTVVTDSDQLIRQMYVEGFAATRKPRSKAGQAVDVGKAIVKQVLARRTQS